MTKKLFHFLLVVAALTSVPQIIAQIVLPGGGTLTPFADPGFTSERRLQIMVKNGPFLVVTGQFTLPGGGEIDWHDHPGTGVITVTKGAFDEFKENGCQVLHGVGSVFFETQGEIHRVVNTSATEPAEGLITFFLPLGSNPVTFVAPPQERPCPPDRSDE